MSFIRACQLDKVSRIAFVNYLQSPIGYMIDMSVFAYMPSAAEWISVIVVAFAGLLLLCNIIQSH
jgi:hypothetical protein